MDEVPPNHPPVTAWMQGFDDLVNLVTRLGLSRPDQNRFCRDIRNDLKDIRDNAASAGPNNNFYNDLKALYELYHDRVEYAREDAVARRRARQEGASGSQG
ncbi:hypothetical protein NPX13_g2218 [Xylaria arbuscula]|uniref:Uncharacterized protein n=1 Tax=Xylaria arbuscula TaxID=114810 RepID=A0A9W8TQK2_9PEZI|nr:hypothetical protein NPX13_g2218 [Xylaria arbuscula]